MWTAATKMTEWSARWRSDKHDKVDGKEEDEEGGNKHDRVDGEEDPINCDRDKQDSVGAGDWNQGGWQDRLRDRTSNNKPDSDQKSTSHPKPKSRRKGKQKQDVTEDEADMSILPSLSPSPSSQSLSPLTPLTSPFPLKPQVLSGDTGDTAHEVLPEDSTIAMAERQYNEEYEHEGGVIMRNIIVGVLSVCPICWE